MRIYTVQGTDEIVLDVPMYVKGVQGDGTILVRPGDLEYDPVFRNAPPAPASMRSFIEHLRELKRAAH